MGKGSEFNPFEAKGRKTQTMGLKALAMQFAAEKLRPE